MKSLFLAAALFIAAITTQSFARDIINVTPKTLATFTSTFGKVTDVQWTIDGHMYRADFVKGNEKTIAFFTIADGELVVTCQYLSVSELPEGLQHSLKAQTADATLKEIFVVNKDENKDYFATIEKDGKKTVLKSGIKNWTVYIKK
jgi:hypothetical protein